MILLIAQSVLGSAVPSMLGISIDSTARITHQTTTPFVTTPAPLGSRDPETPYIAHHTVLLRSALLAVKAATILHIGESNEAAWNEYALWTASCSITERMRDVVTTLKQHTGSYMSESADEAEHLAELLVQVLLQAMSQGPSRAASKLQSRMCCSMLHALLAPHQHSTPQPLSNVVAAAVTSQSESPMQPDLQCGTPKSFLVSHPCGAQSQSVCVLCAASKCLNFVCDAAQVLPIVARCNLLSCMLLCHVHDSIGYNVHKLYRPIFWGHHICSNVSMCLLEYLNSLPMTQRHDLYCKRSVAAGSRIEDRHRKSQCHPCVVPTGSGRPLWA